jgi:branched-chain amino acid transport system permease protein
MADIHPIDQLAASHRLRPAELLPWAAAIACYFAFDGYLALGTQIMIMALFALSLDLILGYTGIITLGHAAFFGVGAYTAGIVARWFGWTEPISALLFSGLVAALAGAITGAIILRTRGLTLLMLTMAFTAMFHELANKAGTYTGGADGLQGVTIDPIFGVFRFDMFGRTTYVYCLVVLFLGWVFARRLVHSPFGRSLVGIRENATRMSAIGSPVMRRMVMAYTISAGLAGIAGALLTQTTQFVALKVLSFELSGEILIMLVLGGVGRLYGAFVGAPAFMIFQDTLSKTSPYYWYFWLGLLLVATVMFARGGLIGLVLTVVQRVRRPRP